MPPPATGAMAGRAAPGRAAACPAAAEAGSTGRWFVDAARSTLRVRVKVGLFAVVCGTFSDVSGQVEVTADPVGSQVEVAVATASLSSGSRCMDALLHGAGMVDSARNPLLSFVSRAVRVGRSQGTWLLDGLLATDGAVLDVSLQMSDPVRTDGALVFRATGSLPSAQAVRLLSHQGVERLLGRTMDLDLTVVATRAG